MAKSKNHTAHNQSHMGHRNGIKKPRKHRHASTKGGMAYWGIARGLTRVGSRRVVQLSTAFMIFFSIFGKFGVFSASIPLPIYAAMYMSCLGSLLMLLRILMLDIMDLLLNKAEILKAMDKEVLMVTINHANTTVAGYTLEGSLGLFLSALWMLSKRGFRSKGHPSLATEVSMAIPLSLIFPLEHPHPRNTHLFTCWF